MEKDNAPVKKERTQLIIWVGAGSLLILLIFLWPQFMSLKYDQTLIAMAKIQNMNCPKMVAENTQLDSVTLKAGRNVRYHYTVFNIVKDSADADLCDRTKEGLIESMKNGEVAASEELADNNVTIIYMYNDKNGIPFCTIPLTPDQYDPDKKRKRD